MLIMNQISKIRPIISLCLIMVLIFFSSLHTIADSPNEPTLSSFIDLSQNNPSLQNMISQSSPGETIHLENTTYNEHVIINKSISLVGAKIGNSRITSNHSPLVTIRADQVYIENITFLGITNHTSHGIYLYSSSQVKLSNNTFSSFDNASIIIDNTSQYNQVINTYFHHNLNGLMIFGNHNTITSNHFENHSQNAIIIGSNTTNNHIISNTFKNNTDYSLYILPNASNTSVYLNNFMDVLNANNKGKHTNWHHPSLNLGNYWKTYQGKDDNQDGIGDIPYTITGNLSISDPYPLMSPIQDSSIPNDPYSPELFTVLIVGVIASIILLAPIAYWWRKNVLKK